MIFFFILITCLLDVVLIFDGRLVQKIFPFLLSSDPIMFKTWNNQDFMTGIFLHLILLHFTLSSHWLPRIFSFVLIGHYHNSNKTFEKKKKKLKCYMYLSAPVFLLYTHWPCLQGSHLLPLQTCSVIILKSAVVV